MKEIKGTIRVPTKTQYAYIEMEIEGTPKEIVEAYNELNEAYWGQGKEQLSTKEWNKCLDDYLTDCGMSEEMMHKLSEKQLWLIKEIDKSFNRLKTKEN